MIMDSEYVFDNLKPIDQLRAKPVKLIQKKIPSDQWNDFDYADPDAKGFDGFDVVWNNLAPLIGICLIVFAELESELEYNLYELVNDRASQLGMVVTNTMSFEQKLQTYITLLRLVDPEPNTQYRADISQLKKHLKRAGEVRNIITHAKWPSLTKDGYVFSSVDTIGSSSLELNLKYFELNRNKLEEYRAYLQGVTNAVNYIHSEYLEILCSSITPRQNGTF